MSLKCYITSKTLFDLCGRDFPIKTGYTYEDIEFPDGYEKPSKEAFEAKLKELTTVHYLKELRQERNRRLAEVDWVTLKAYSTGTPVSEEWVTYMQTLRN